MLYHITTDLFPSAFHISSCKNEIYIKKERNNELRSKRIVLVQVFEQGKREKHREALVEEINWSSVDFPWSKKVEDAREKFIGALPFRRNQLEAINAALAKKDTFIIMPTGGGKSMCYQIPAMVLQGLTLIISPLLSLMEDQVAIMSAMGINACFLSSISTKENTSDIYSNLDGDIRLLYVTPEMVNIVFFILSLKYSLSKIVALCRKM